MPCVTPREISKSAGPGYPVLPLHVACGVCQGCRVDLRNERVFVAAAEAAEVRSRMGPGHCWMATLTVDDEHLVWTKPQPHNLEEWDRRLKPRADAKAASKEGPDRAVWQRDRLRYRHGLSDEEVRAYRRGTYQSMPTLDRRLVNLWRKRCEKRGIFARKFECGEYGDELGRPHWHVLLMDITREEFEQVLRLWPYGFTDPCPTTWTGQRLIDAQVHRNATGAGAAAKYVAKYLADLREQVTTAAEFARLPAYVERKQTPALGWTWGKQNLVPVMDRLYERTYDANPLRWSSEEDREGYAALMTKRASMVVRLDRWHYKPDTDYRDRLMKATQVPERAVTAAKVLSMELEQVRYMERERLGSPEAEAWARELEKRKADVAQRHEQWQRKQERMVAKAEREMVDEARVEERRAVRWAKGTGAWPGGTAAAVPV